MNKKIFIAFLLLLNSIAVYAWQFDTVGNLKIYHRDHLILEENGFAGAVYSGNPATVTTPVFTSRRSVSKVKNDFLIALDAKFSPAKFVPAYQLQIPETVMKDAKLTAIVPGKRGRTPVAIPQQNAWQLEKVVFLVVEKGDIKFALDFEWTGSSAFQHYRDEAWSATLTRNEKGLQITLPRLEAPVHGGDYKARITLRTQETNHTRLHGTHQAHYKKNMPVNRFFAFTTVKRARPVIFGGTVKRDNDIKEITKRFTKAIVVPIIYRIPGKYSGGGMSFPRHLKYHANKTANPVYAYAVSGGIKAHEFTMALPDGYYFLTLYVRDDSAATAYKYTVDVNGVKRMIAVTGSTPAATRFVVKVENGKVNIKFPGDRKPWALSAVSATWITGIADMDIEVKNMKEFQL